MSNVLSSSIMETLIGLLFVYFVLSIICSSVAELISSLLDLRAKDLEYAIAQLLANADVTKGVYEHPLIVALGSGDAKHSLRKAMGARLPLSKQTKTPWDWAAWTAGLPSYISAQTFALALFDYYHGDIETPQTLVSLRNAVSTRAQQGESAAKAVLALIDAGGGSSLLLKSGADVKSLVKTLLPDGGDKTDVLSRIDEAMSLEQVRAAMSILPDGSSKTAVLKWLNDTQTGLEEARGRVEKWFDSSMNSVTGLYRRQVQYCMMAIALVVVLVSGADTIRMWNAFQNNSTLRSFVVAQAGQVVQAQPTAAPSSGSAPVGNMTISSFDPTTVMTVTNTLNELQGVLGYDLPKKQADGTYQPAWPGWIFSKVVGLLLTVFAVALGAPFWFDVLKKVANLRGVEQAPAKSTSRG